MKLLVSPDFHDRAGIGILGSHGLYSLVRSKRISVKFPLPLLLDVVFTLQ